MQEQLIHFNPIIVLFLTTYVRIIYCLVMLDFNPIIVLFLTGLLKKQTLKLHYFNPIIVLFLTLCLALI